MGKFKQSFEEWCVKNNRIDLLDRWDYELNEKFPNDVSIHSGKKYYFKCPNGNHESELKNIEFLANGKQLNINCDKCKSFAQYIIDLYGNDVLLKIWNENNIISPWDVYKSSRKKVIFNCEHNKKHTYENSCDNYVNQNQRCPKCVQKNRLKNKSVGDMFKNIFEYWSERNVDSPSDYSMSSTHIAWFKCENKVHEDYQRSIRYSVKKDFKCPICNDKRKIFRGKDLTGNKYGHLTVVGLDVKKNKKGLYWLCKCDCGNEILKSTKRYNLETGRVSSCGCTYTKNGSQNPNWKGGKSTKNQLIRTSSKYDEWRIEVYKRNYYTCQCCGVKGGVNLNAHHIYSFAEYEDLRLDIFNGITLCEKCHRNIISGSFHNTYGTHNNTPEQLEEYINNKRKQLGIDIPFNIEEYQNGKILKPNDISNINNIDKYIDTRKIKKISELVMMKPISVINQIN